MTEMDEKDDEGHVTVLRLRHTLVKEEATHGGDDHNVDGEKPSM